jgi:hypothetical protein
MSYCAFWRQRPRASPRPVSSSPSGHIRHRSTVRERRQVRLRRRPIRRARTIIGSEGDGASAGRVRIRPGDGPISPAAVTRAAEVSPSGAIVGAAPEAGTPRGRPLPRMKRRRSRVARTDSVRRGGIAIGSERVTILPNGVAHETGRSHIATRRRHIASVRVTYDSAEAAWVREGAATGLDGSPSRRADLSSREPASPSHLPETPSRPTAEPMASTMSPSPATPSAFGAQRLARSSPFGTPDQVAAGCGLVASPSS